MISTNPMVWQDCEWRVISYFHPSDDPSSHWRDVGFCGLSNRCIAGTDNVTEWERGQASTLGPPCVLNIQRITLALCWWGKRSGVTSCPQSPLGCVSLLPSSLCPPLPFLLCPFLLVPEGYCPQSCCTHWLLGRRGWGSTDDVGEVWAGAACSSEAKSNRLQAQTSFLARPSQGL